VNRPARPGAVLATLCMSLTVITMNTSLLNVGLPTLARQLHSSNTGLEWIVDGYALVFAAFLMAAGALGDRWGGRPVMLAGLAVFGICSMVATTSHTTTELIAARCGMGLGGSLVTPMTLSVMRDVFPDEGGLRRAVGLWAATASGGAIVAPLVAGALLSAFWWGSLFVVNVPLTAVMLVAVWLTVPDPATRQKAKADWAGLALSIVVATGLVFALIEGPSLGWGSATVGGALAAAVVALALFCWWEQRCSHPLVDLRCFANARFSVGCGVVAMQYFFSYGTSFLVTQYLQLVLGLAPLATGFVFMPSAAVLMVVAPYGARAFGRYGARTVTTVSLVLAAAGTAVLAAVGAGSSIALVLTALVLINLAIGLMAPGTTSMVMSAVRPDQAGMASGMQNTTRQLGGALGVAICGSVAATGYSDQVASRLHGTAAAPFVSVARQSLAAALHAAAPSSRAFELIIHAARTAFVDGMHLAAWCTVAVAVAVAVTAWTVLGRSRAVPTMREPAVPDVGVLEPAPDEA
jgi:EmrB/QacA subfamily drug resistance transporter